MFGLCDLGFGVAGLGPGQQPVSIWDWGLECSKGSKGGVKVSGVMPRKGPYIRHYLIGCLLLRVWAGGPTQILNSSKYPKPYLNLPNPTFL